MKEKIFHIKNRGSKSCLNIWAEKQRDFGKFKYGDKGIFLAVSCPTIVKGWTWDGHVRGFHLTKKQALNLLDGLKKQVLKIK